MRNVRVDAQKKRAYVEPGATLADFDEVAQSYGLATDLVHDCRIHWRHFCRPAQHADSKAASRDWIFECGISPINRRCTPTAIGAD
jgi:hypothetical protein